MESMFAALLSVANVLVKSHSKVKTHIQQVHCIVANNQIPTNNLHNDATPFLHMSCCLACSIYRYM